MKQKIKTLLSSPTSRDTLVTLGGNGAVAVGGMLFTILIARSLAPTKFGVFSAIFALAVLFSSIADVGISSALVNFLPKMPGKRSTIISITFWVQLAVVLILFLLTLSFIPFKDSILPGSSTLHVVFLAFWVVSLALELFGQAILKAEKRFLFTSILMGANSWLKLTLTFIFFLTNSLDINTIILVSLLSSALIAIIGLFAEFKNITPIFPKVQAKQIFHFAKWIALMRIFSVAVARVDIILLNVLSSSFQAGIFAAAGRVALLFALLVSSLGSVVAPRFSGFTKKSQVRSYLKKITLLISGVSVLMVLSIFFAPLIIKIVFGPEYLAAIPVFRYLTLAMIPFLLSIITVNPLIYYFNQPNFVALSTIVQVVILVVLDIILIPQFGAIAPTISLAVSNIVVLALTGHRLNKLLA